MVIFRLCSYVEVLCVYVCTIHRGYLSNDFIKLRGVIHFQFVGSYSSLLAFCKTFTIYTSGDTTSCYNWSPGRLGQTSDNLPSDTFISDPVLTTQFGLVSVYTDSNSYTRGLLRIPFDNALLIIRRLFTFVEQLCTT